jgi:hypothetical protein
MDFTRVARGKSAKSASASASASAMDQFIKRKGGINKCASWFAQRLGRRREDVPFS